MHAVLVAKVDPVADRDEWLRHRKGGLGGSDAASVLGLNKHQSPFSVWVEKTQPDIGDDDAGEAAFWGRTLEPVLASRYDDRRYPRVAVWEPDGLFRHPEHRFMLATPDRWVAAETDQPEWLLEIKTTGEYLGSAWWHDIPDPALCQVHHYLTVTGLPHADIAVLIGGNKYRDPMDLPHLRVMANADLSAVLIEREREFWALVETLTPPALDDTESTAEALSRMYFEAEADQAVDLPDTAAALLAELASVKQAQKELDSTREGMESQLKAWLGSAERGEIGGLPAVTWKSPKPKRTINTKLMRRVHTDIVESFTELVPSSRRLHIPIRKAKK